MKYTEIYDSTLRDGSQGEGISFSVSDKIKIVRALDEFGIDYIEAGNPGSNPKDLLFFEEMQKIKLTHAKLCAFGSTRRYNVETSEDANIKSLLSANTPVCAIFGKSWDLHVTEILKISLEDNLEIVFDTVSYLKGLGKEVVFDAEHFFDGYKNNPDYAMKVIDTAVRAGADCVCLCDTNGGMMPDKLGEITKAVCMTFPDTKIGIHCHDDCGCAVANSVTAVQNGASSVQGTFVGFGERCGNADLATIIANLALKCGYLVGGNINNLRQTSIFISEVSNVRLRNNKPYVGKSAFAHKGGMHIDGVMKLSRSFEHIDPELVGNHRKFLTSEVSGRGTILPKIQKFIPSIDKNSPEASKLLSVLKEREFYGYTYEAAEASFELLVKKQLGLWEPSFNVEFFKTNDDFPASDGSMQASAIVSLNVKGQTEITGAVGNGPVNALDIALRRALCVFYPQISSMHLSDFKVRVIDMSSTTAAKIRVLIESTNGDESWTTIGVSNDVIEASFTALTDSFEYILSQKGE